MHFRSRAFVTIPSILLGVLSSISCVLENGPEPGETRDYVSSGRGENIDTHAAALVDVSSCGGLASNQSLARGQAVSSCNGRATLVHQTDGNVVLYDGVRALWDTKTAGQATTSFPMQGDGNLVLYNGAAPLWNSGTWNNPGARLAVRDDCNMVIYNSAGNAIWQTGTQCTNAAISFDRQEVFHRFYRDPVTNQCTYNQTTAPYAGIAALSWKSFGIDSKTAVTLTIYNGQGSTKTPAGPPQELNTQSTGFVNGFAALATCTNPTRTYVATIHYKNGTTYTPLATAELVVHGDEATSQPPISDTENLPDAQYISVYSLGASGQAINWCVSDAAWVPGQSGYDTARSLFQSVRDGLAVGSRNHAKRAAVTLGINAFNYRAKDDPAHPPQRNPSCIATKIRRAMQLAEDLNIPIDLHVTFSVYATQRPDLWNHWIDTSNVPAWVNYHASLGDEGSEGANFINYVTSHKNKDRDGNYRDNTTNVEWTGVLGQGQPMHTNYLGWYGPQGLYTAPILNLASPVVRAEVSRILTNHVIPSVGPILTRWHDEGKDYLLAGFTAGLEDSFIAQPCSGSDKYGYYPPEQYCDSMDGRSSTVNTYGYMAWMQRNCSAGPTCASPAGQRIATLRTVLNEYENSIYELLYRTNLGMPRQTNIVRDKLYTHLIYKNPDGTDFTASGFNGFSHFGASFYPPTTTSDITNLGQLLSLDNYDGWMIAETSSHHFAPSIISLLGSSNLPNNKLVAMNIWDDMPSSQISQVKSYLGSSSLVSSGRRYGGALSTDRALVMLSAGGGSSVNLSWWTNYPEWNQAGSELKLRYFIDDGSDGLYDEYHGYIGPTPLPAASAGLNVGISIGNHATRTYVFELVSGRNQSHVLATARVRLQRQ